MTADLPYIGTVIADREDRDWVTSAELITETGISYRQLDYWCRTNLLTALPVKKAQARYGALAITPETPGSGYQRRFDQAQVTRARLIHQLLDTGFTLQAIRRDIDPLLEDGTVTVGPLTITIHTPSGDSAA